MQASSLNHHRCQQQGPSLKHWHPALSELRSLSLALWLRGSRKIVEALNQWLQALRRLCNRCQWRSRLDAHGLVRVVPKRHFSFFSSKWSFWHLQAKGFNAGKWRQPLHLRIDFSLSASFKQHGGMRLNADSMPSTKDLSIILEDNFAAAAVSALSGNQVVEMLRLSGTVTR